MNVAIIPARSGSKRIKNKNIRLFHGRPIIYWTINTAIKSKLFDKVIVSTNSTKIAKIAKNFGADIPFIRSSKLADDKTSIGEVMKNTLIFLKERKIKINYACLLYAISKFNSSVHRALKIKNKRIFPNNYKNVFKRSQDLEPLYYDNAQFTFGKLDSWLKKKHAFTAKTFFVEIPSFRTQDIDTLDEWKKAEIIFKILKNK